MVLSPWMLFCSDTTCEKDESILLQADKVSSITIPIKMPAQICFIHSPISACHIRYLLQVRTTPYCRFLPGPRQPDEQTSCQVQRRASVLHWPE